MIKKNGQLLVYVPKPLAEFINLRCGDEFIIINHPEGLLIKSDPPKVQMTKANGQLFFYIPKYIASMARFKAGDEFQFVRRLEGILLKRVRKKEVEKDAEQK